MVQVHVTPPIGDHQEKRTSPAPAGAARLPGTSPGGAALLSCPTPAGGGIPFSWLASMLPSGGFLAVKKLIVLAVLGLGAFAAWRKVQSDRAELDLWTEATAADED